MTNQEMHYSFRLKADKIHGLTNDDFVPAQIDWLLNLAQLIEVKKRYLPFNNARKGFEGIQKRIDDLSTLHVKSPHKQPAIIPTLLAGRLLDSNIYECKFSDFEFTYMFLTGLRAKISDGDDCIKSIGLTQIQEDDLNEGLINVNTRPDFNWGTVLFTIDASSADTDAPGSIYIYSGDFEVDEVYPSYLRYPRKMFFSGYASLDGLYTAITAAVSCELPTIIHDNIVDTACELAAAPLQDPEFLQLAKVNSEKFEY